MSLACALFGTKAGLEPCPITFIKSLALFLSATALFLPWEYLSFFLVSYLQFRISNRTVSYMKKDIVDVSRLIYSLVGHFFL